MYHNNRRFKHGRYKYTDLRYISWLQSIFFLGTTSNFEPLTSGKTYPTTKTHQNARAIQPCQVNVADQLVIQAVSPPGATDTGGERIDKKTPLPILEAKRLRVLPPSILSR